MNTPVVKDPSHPDFPHGTPRGYRYGCKAGAPCPNTDQPCAEAHAERLREHRARVKKGPPPGEGRLLVKVQGRITSALRKVTIQDLSERSGLPVEQIEWVRGLRGQMRLEEETAAPLDHAWAWFLFGEDVSRPGFPHGSGYGRGCRCSKCSRSASKARTLSKAGYKGPDALVSDPRIGAHLARLVEAAGTVTALQQIIKLAHESIEALLEDPAARVKMRTARDLAEWTPARVRAMRTDTMLTSSAHAHRLMGMMLALGYPRAWQFEAAGLSGHHRRLDRTETVQVATDRAIRALAARIGDTPATTEDHGIPAMEIKRSKTRARREGFYPPMFYDEDGRLDYRAIPDHPWSKVDTRFAEKLDLAQALLTAYRREESFRAVCLRFGYSDGKPGDRMIAAMGLRGAGSGVDEAGRVHPDYQARADWIMGMIEDWLHGDRGPVEVGLWIGVYETAERSHPEAAQFYAARTLAQARFTAQRIAALVTRRQPVAHEAVAA